MKSAAVIAGITALFPLVYKFPLRHEVVLIGRSIGHPQQEHDTRHGSMEQTTWFLEEERENIEVGGHKYGSGDSGAPMLCSLVCKSMGRHVHLADCIAGERGQCAGGTEVEHISAARRNSTRGAMDWVTHSLYWKKSGEIIIFCRFVRHTD